ncbi:MAG: LON peptidase substrate-binding domain-containing protein [Gemmatimonadales bacterium]
MPFRLPLFPLELALFPGMAQPLHIFEPRYREMLQDCLESDERFGLLPGNTGESPAPGAVGCVAHIRATQALDDGRSNILVQGGERFTVQELDDRSRPYLLGMVEPLHDTDLEEIDPERVQDLTRLGKEYLAAIQVLNDAPMSSFTWSGDAEEVSLQAAAFLEADLEVKRQLLAMQSAQRRIGIVQRLLRHQTSEVTRRAVTHVHARSNGGGNRSALGDLEP